VRALQGCEPQLMVLRRPRGGQSRLTGGLPQHITVVVVTEIVAVRVVPAWTIPVLKRVPVRRATVGTVEQRGGNG
jgi:hypothetical protein